MSLLLLLANISFCWVPAIASYRLHNKMFWRVLRAPIRFFDCNSTGSIMNRFSKDIATMDHLLPNLYLYSLDSTLMVIFTFIAASLVHWITIVCSFLLFVITTIFRYQLIRVIRQIKHLESASKNKILTHVSLTMHGLSSIHSLGLESHQNRLMCEYQNIHSNTWRVYFGCIRLFAFQIDVLSSIYIFTVSIILILSSSYLSPAVSAFALSQISILIDNFQYSLRSTAEAEMNMVSVERVLQYTRLDKEPSLHRNTTDITCTKFIITKAEIAFEGVDLSYAEDLPLVLKDVTFFVRSLEKVAIVGRTGAGKSSILAVLLRFVDILSGRVTIDGMDIRELGLHELREQIAVIPQDPVLFSGSIKLSLDPFSSFEEEELWQVLEQIQLKDKINGLEGKLNFEISEGGTNFSVGERQLLCLARAILKHSRIVFMDEATSNVDTYTDSIIQKLLRSNFSHSTLLTIAHRIESVLDYDRILVVSGGQIVEFDTPFNLLANSSSQFSQLFRYI